MVPADDRGLSEVVGFILIFSILVISFSVYQGILVPQQNKEAEFEHNQRVQSQIQDLRNAILTAAGTGTGPSVSITLGASYPQRTLANNLGISAGTIETATRQGDTKLKNITALDPETSDYFGNSTLVLGPFDSKAIVYRPTYSFYSEAPESVYENTLAYNRFDNEQNLPVTDQTVVDGRQILLVSVNGSVSEASQSTISLNPEAISAPTTKVAVTNASGPLTITLSTGLSVQNWTTILEDEFDPTGTKPNAYVTDIRNSGPDQVTLVLEKGVTYDLRLARIGVGSGVDAVGPKYVTDVQGDDSSVVENGSKRLEVEVRDRFNNPVSNATVTTNVVKGPGGIDGESQVVTNSRGRAAFVYTAPEDIDTTETVEVEGFIEPNTDANHSVTFDLRVLDTGGVGGENETGTEEINPSGSGTVTLQNRSSVGGAGSTLVNFDLKNDTGASGDVRLIEARISFYMTGGNDPRPDFAHLDDDSNPSVGGTNLSVGDEFVAVTPAISLSEGSTEIHLEFNEQVGAGDFYVISMRFRLPDGEFNTFTYFVSHPS